MKSKDITTLILIGIISAIASVVISSKVFVTPTSRQQNVESVPIIETSFPDAKVRPYLSSSNVDPVVHIQIGGQQGSNTFSSGSN